VAIHPKASFTEAKSLVQAILSSAGFASEVSSEEHPSFVRGRCARVSVGVDEIGVLGEVSPSTIEAFELNYPMIAFELDLERLFQLKGESKRS
jgi:phenylalanyl-tRNA synthetase beta chain